MNSPIKLPELPTLVSTVINDACWKFIEAMPYELPGPIFNNFKPAFYAAICPVLNAYAEQAVRDALAALKIDERAEFEAAVQEEYGTSASSMLLRDADGDYLTLNTEWVFWLKRAALTAAPPKENNHAEGADK